MCGRLARHIKRSGFDERFKITDPFTGPNANMQPHSNTVPTDPILMVRKSATGREAKEIRWGLIPPSFTADQVKKFTNSNARLDKLKSGLPWWLDPFRAGQTCLVPATGYYEWVGPPGNQTRYYFRRPSGDMFVFAGLWQQHPTLGESVTILTTDPGEYVAKIHDRTPIWLMEDKWDVWLNEATIDLLHQPVEDDLEAYPVRRNIRDDDPESSLVPEVPVQGSLF
jgi:putative SOS response-associated peptidase YedK